MIYHVEASSGNIERCSNAIDTAVNNNLTPKQGRVSVVEISA